MIGRDGRKIIDQIRGPEFSNFWIFDFFLVTVGRIAPNKVSTDSPVDSLSVDIGLD